MGNVFESVFGYFNSSSRNKFVRINHFHIQKAKLFFYLHIKHSALSIFRVEIVPFSVSMEPMRCSEGLFCVGTELIWPAYLRYVEQWKEATATDFLLVKRRRDFVTKKR